MVERVWQQEKEAAGHVPSEVKEQGVCGCWCSACFLLIIQAKIPAHRMEPPIVTVYLPTSVSLS